MDETPTAFLLQHPNGRQAPIAKMGLSDDHLNEIAALPRLDNLPATTPELQNQWDKDNLLAQAKDQVLSDTRPVPSDKVGMSTPEGVDQKIQNAAFNINPAIDLNAPMDTPQVAQAQPQVAPQVTTPDPGVSFAGMNQTIKGINDSANAQSQGALEQQNLIKAYQTTLADTQKTYADKRTSLDTEQAQLQKDYTEGKIDPDHFWNSKTGVKGGAARVLSMLGLFLGGMSQSKTGVNPAQAMLDKAISQDIEAQKENLGKKKTLLDLNHQKYGDLQLAEQATKLDMLNMFQTQLQGVAAKTNSQVVKANALQQTGQIQQQIDLYKDTLAKATAQKKLLSTIGSQVLPDQALPLLDKEHQEQVVRIGKNQNVLARSKEDASAIKEAQPAIDNTLNLIHQMKSEIISGKSPRAIGGDLPLLGSATEAGREGRNKQNILKSAFREIGKSPLKISEYSNESYLNDIIPNPAQYHQDEVLKSLDRLEKELISKTKAAQSQRLLVYNPTQLNVNPGLAK